MKKIRLIALTVVFSVMFTGCWFKAGDELLKAPKTSKDYLALQKMIDRELSSGSVIASPKSGTNRNTLQLVDIDADSEEEAVAFFRESAVSGVFNLVVYKKVNEDYIEIGRIKGHGNDIDTVEYPKISEVGGGGIAVSWKIGNQLEKGLTIAKVQGEKMDIILDTQYMSYLILDIDSDGLDEIFTINQMLDAVVLNMYKMNGEKLELTSSVQLASEIESVLKTTTGSLVSGSHAIAIDSRPLGEGGVITDLITIENGNLVNLTIDSTSYSGLTTYRPTNTFTTKLYDNDILYIPSVVEMKGTNKDSINSLLWITNWHLYDLYNPLKSDIFTYHNSAEGWYYNLSENQKNTITIEKTTISNIKITSFKQYISEGNKPTIFEIYTVPKDEYNTTYFSDDHIKLSENSSNIFLAKNYKLDGSMLVTNDEIAKNFKLIINN